MVKSKPIPCTKEQMDSLERVALGDDFFEMLFKVARTTGRRLGEYTEVKVKDIKVEPNGTKIMTTRVLKKRQRVEKDAILSEEVYTLILRWITKNKLNQDDYIFKHVGRRQIQHKTSQYGKKAGIPHRVSFHSFRHYFITSLLKQNWSYDKITKLTGHTSVATIAVYDHVVAQDVAEDALEALKHI